MIAENPGFDPAQLRAFTAYRVLHDVLGTPLPGAVRAEAYRTLAAAPGLRVLQRDGDQRHCSPRASATSSSARGSTPATAACSRSSACCCAAASRSRARRGVVDRAVVEADQAALSSRGDQPRDLVAQVAHLGVVGERQRAVAGLEAVA